MRSYITISLDTEFLAFVWDDEALGVDAAGRVCRGAVTWSQFGRRHQRPSNSTTVAAAEATGDAADVVAAVRRWWTGTADALNPVPVLQAGSEFRQRVWQALRTVPGGDAVTYAELAVLAGNAKAVRAVGTAMAQNAVAPFVPCHRVVRSDGSLGNYAYGVALKERLLIREGVEVE